MKNNEKQIVEQFLAMARLMPEEKILELVKDGIQKYKILKNEDSKTELMMYTQMWIMKMQIDKDGMLKVMSEIGNLYNIKDGINNANKN